MLKLELESRARTAYKGFNGLIGHFYQLLESRYQELVRVAIGEETLIALQSAFERPSLTTGAE